MASYDIFRNLIKLHKQDELDYETFCDAVDDFSSDRFEQRKLTLGLRKFIEGLEFYNFADVKKLTSVEREKLAGSIANYVDEYLADHPETAEWHKNLDSGSEYGDEYN